MFFFSKFWCCLNILRKSFGMKLKRSVRWNTDDLWYKNWVFKVGNELKDDSLRWHGNQPQVGVTRRSWATSRSPHARALITLARKCERSRFTVVPTSCKRHALFYNNKKTNLFFLGGDRGFLVGLAVVREGRSKCCERFESNLNGTIVSWKMSMNLTYISCLWITK